MVTILSHDPEIASVLCDLTIMVPGVFTVDAAIKEPKVGDVF